MDYDFDDDVIATTVGEYILFGLPISASVSTFCGEYDLFSPHGSIGKDDEGIGIWFDPQSGIFIRGTVERGCLNDLVAREIDTIDAWQDVRRLTFSSRLESIRLFSRVTPTLLDGWLHLRREPRAF